MIPVFVAVFYFTVIPYNYVISAVIFALAAFTDFLDGYIARKYNLVTNFGKFLDPIADKVLVSTALIIFIAPINNVEIFPFNLNYLLAIFVALILARELIVSGFRLVAANQNVVIAADKSGKLKTFFTDVTIVFILCVMGFNVFALQVTSLVLMAITTLLTVYSGIECLVKNKSVLKESK